MLAFFSRTACNKKQGEPIYPNTLTRIHVKNHACATKSAPSFEFGLPHDCLNINRQVHFLRWEQGTSSNAASFFSAHGSKFEMSAKWRVPMNMNSTHRIQLWVIYPHLVDVHIKCIGKYTIHGSYGQRDVAHLKLQPRSACCFSLCFLYTFRTLCMMLSQYWHLLRLLA